MGQCRLIRQREITNARSESRCRVFDLSWGGIGTYTEEIVKHLLRVDPNNEYILMYPGFGSPRKLIGRYRRYRNATEVETDFSRVPSGWYWDQMIVPKVAKHFGIDMLFNPFLSVPIRGKFKKVMVMHNVEYHTIRNVYDWKMYTRWFLLEKVILPAADRVISISEVMTRDFARTVEYTIDHVRTIYHGVSERFRILKDAEKLREAKEEYCLPDKFILFVGHLYPQKNFSVLAQASRPHREGDSARPCDSRPAAVEISAGPTDDRRAWGWVTAFIYCTSFPTTIFRLFTTRPRALSTRPCTSPSGSYSSKRWPADARFSGANSGAIPEIAGGAAMLFDPHDPEELAMGIRGMVADPELRQGYVEKGLRRAREFAWEK